MVLRKLSIIYRVYKRFLMFIGLVFTVAMSYITYENYDAESFRITAVILGRALLFCPVLYLFQGFNENEFMYYRNLGITKWQLLSYIFALDLTIAIIIILTTYAIA